MDLPSNQRFLFRYKVAAVVALCCAALVGCNATSGRITPAHFKFKQVVKKSGTEASGWRAVCIDARFTHGNTGLKGICRFEVGVPIRNTEQGDISLTTAQEEAANMANRAAHIVMSEATPDDLTGALCVKFKAIYNQLLGQKIYGATVTECRTVGIPTILFDPTASNSP